MRVSELRDMNNYNLLNLYEAFVKMSHYEAVDEFDHLRTLVVDYDDVHNEVLNRMRASGSRET